MPSIFGSFNESWSSEIAATILETPSMMYAVVVSKVLESMASGIAMQAITNSASAVAPIAANVTSDNARLWVIPGASDP